jgi:hypothetical protein
MRKLLFFFLLASVPLAAQPPAGTITTTSLSTIIGTAGTIICTFTNPSPPAFHAVCVAGAASMTQDVTPAIGATSGAVGSMNAAPNAITWVVQQPTTGVLTWQIAANGTAKSGTF